MPESHNNSQDKLILANRITVRRFKKVLIAPSIDGAINFESDSKSDSYSGTVELLPIKYVAAMAKNLESLGFAMTESLLAASSKLSLPQMTVLNASLLNELALAKGAHRHLKPMYPDFPKQVMETSEAELYLNALKHYLSGGVQMPEPVAKKLFGIFPMPAVAPGRAVLLENTFLIKLGLASHEEFETTFTQLLKANSSLSSNDKEDIVSFFSYFDGAVKRFLPAKISQRENKAFILAQLLQHNLSGDLVKQYCDTATDLLRLAVALSDGDISLAEATKFKAIKRSRRKTLLAALNNLANPVEDMLRWKGRWLRLGERLHPGEFKKQYPQAYAAFEVLRNNLPADTFNSKLEKLLEQRDVDAAVDLLKTRPGDFARRLDHLLRLSTDKQEDIAFAFGKVAVHVSTPVLLQVLNHFQHRRESRPLRVFLPKGSLAKAQAIVNDLCELPDLLCQLVTGLCRKALLERFSSLPKLGKCYIDPALKEFMVPFSQRSASKSLRTTSRGSRMPLPDTDILRFFTWWKNGRDSTDIDLSAALFDEDFAFVDALTYYQLKNFGGCHSGDIVDAPDGASEFIDISIPLAVAHKARYVVMSLLSYTHQPFCDLPECFAGWMARKEAQSGEVYEPKTVQDKLDISSNTKVSIPAIFDLVERKVIWADLSLSSNPNWYNNVAGNLYGIQLSLRSVIELNKPNLYDLMIIHAQARGSVVASESEADKVFSAVELPFDLSRIASDFMA